MLFFALLIGVLIFSDLRVSFHPKLLVLILNVLFTTATFLLVAYLAARSYLRDGAVCMLLFGCGAMLYGVGAVVAPTAPSLNSVAAIYRLSACASAICHVTGVLFTVFPLWLTQSRRVYLIASYGMGAALVLAVAVASYGGILPRFLIEGQGGTSLNQAVLSVAIVLFGFSAVFLWRLHRLTTSEFAYWYALGLALIVLSLIGALYSDSIGTPLMWVCRMACYLGGIYLAKAVFDVVRRFNSWDVSAAKLLHETEGAAQRERFIPAISGKAWPIFYEIDVASGGVSVVGGLEELLGYGAGEVRFTPDWWRKQIHPDDQRKFLAWERLGVAQSDLIEYRVRTKQGHYLAIEDTACQVKNGLGEVTRVLGYLTNVTGRKAAESALRESQDRLLLAAEAGKIGLWDFDLTNNRLGWSNRCKEIFGLSSEVEVSYPLLLTIIHPEDRDWVEALVKKTVADRSDYYAEYRVVWEDGSEHWVLNHGRTFCDESGAPVRMMGVSIEITELKKAREEAEVADRAKSQFLANISHELRTPMSAILGMTELALDEEANPTIKDYLSTAKESADTLLELLNEILDFSRMEAGKFQLDAAPFSLRKVLDQTLKALGVRAYEKGLDLISDISSDVPDIVVGDCLRLRQVLVNLVGNALKFTACGEVLVSVKAVSRCQTEACLEFSVSDTGIGISAEHKDKIFAPFTQSDSSAARRYGGAGLGLSISSSLVRHMGGKIWVESRMSHGSTFHFTARFPLSPATAGVADGTVVGPGEVRDLRALIVEDSFRSSEVLERTLAHWGMKPESVSGVAAGLTRIREAAETDRPYAVVLIDAVMEGTNGFVLASRLQADPSWGGACILMLSVADRQAHQERWRNLKAVFLEKPISQANLQRALVRALNLGNLGAHSSHETKPESSVVNRRLRILLAEDSVENQKLVTYVLGKSGHIVEVASNGREAVDRFSREAFDLILMDVQMPTMDGYQATGAIRKFEDRLKARVPIVAMTAHAMKGDKERCLAAGMDSYLSKPISIRELTRLVSEFAEGVPLA